jgi:glycogen debranching enzyme
MLAQVQPETLCAWRGPSLFITSTYGRCSDEQPISGFYYREARFLQQLEWRINGQRPWRCEAAATATNVLSFCFVHPEIQEPGGGGTGQSDDEERRDASGVAERSLALRVTYEVQLARLAVKVALTNHARSSVRVTVECLLTADFADIQEAAWGHRDQHAPVEDRAAPGIVTFRYAHPQLGYRTEIHCPRAFRWEGHALRWEIELPPQGTVREVIAVVPVDQELRLSDADVAERESVLQRWQESFAQVSVGGCNAVDDVVECNVRDFASFAMLTGPRDEWLSLQAGMPMYPAFFGRDALTAGWQAGYVDGGEALDAALTRLGRMQADHTDDWRDAQPGRIPYQVRTGPLARLNLNPYSAYYADYASPLMYVISLAGLFAWTGDVARLQRHWDTARRILDWARERGDLDGDGYLEYMTRSSKGTKNQGWKDSGDAIIYDDGTPVPAPIATCELQGYWYLAQELMALMCGFMHAPGDATALHESAAALRERFNRDWWVPAERFFAVALDPQKRPVTAVTSNVGHCLACGIIEHEKLEAVVGRMFEPDLFSGWGVRTLSSRHAYYNPLSYHRGTVWAVEQGTIVFGLRRFGFNARALDLCRALVDLAALYPEYRIPECVGGYARGEWDAPGAYPRANPVQLWNATAFALVMQSVLGLLPLAPLQTLVVDPVLPAWLPELQLRNLKVGKARTTIRFFRNDQGRSEWEVLHKTGTLHVIGQPPPESVTAGIADRLRALLETVA